ncbi:MAG: hypothetical protein H8E98_01595 [Bacteroidetes bacterium]|nr:hypothetical protein [Bacteroidota bacterium]
MDLGQSVYRYYADEVREYFEYLDTLRKKGYDIEVMMSTGVTFGLNRYGYSPYGMDSHRENAVSYIDRRELLSELKIKIEEQILLEI